jgi:hypothetical protein
MGALPGSTLNGVDWLHVLSCLPACLPVAPCVPLQALAPELEDPSRVECMRALTKAGNENWAAFVDPSTNAPLPYGHLVTYPNWVDEHGNVTELPDCPEFPDLGGRIMGTKSNVLPPILTT